MVPANRGPPAPAPRRCKGSGKRSRASKYLDKHLPGLAASRTLSCFLLRLCTYAGCHSGLASAATRAVAGPTATGTQASPTNERPPPPSAAPSRPQWTNLQILQQCVIERQVDPHHGDCHHERHVRAAPEHSQPLSARDLAQPVQRAGVDGGAGGAAEGWRPGRRPPHAHLAAACKVPLAAEQGAGRVRGRRKGRVSREAGKGKDPFHAVYLSSWRCAQAGSQAQQNSLQELVVQVYCPLGLQPRLHSGSTPTQPASAKILARGGSVASAAGSWQASPSPGTLHRQRTACTASHRLCQTL